LKQQGRDWNTLPKATPDKAHFFAETGHAIVHEPFWRYWSTHGLELDGRAGKTPSEALALFGLPLSEPTMETNASGDSVLTQWFERARFEDHGDKGVLLGLLGADVRAGTPGAGPAPAPPAPNACSDVPASVSGAVRPSNCVVQGTEIEIDIQGFRPNEELRLTITAPDGTAETLAETLNIGPDGSVSGLPLETGEIDPGLWTLTFEGITSGHRAIIYFKILPPTSQPAPPPQPDPTPEPAPEPPPADSCDPSYPTVCIPPPPPDLDCGDIPHRRFAVRAPDPHRFDNDNDGIGCESP
jgi:hypothetical protein